MHVVTKYQKRGGSTPDRTEECSHTGKSFLFCIYHFDIPETNCSLTLTLFSPNLKKKNKRRVQKCWPNLRTRAGHITTNHHISTGKRQKKNQFSTTTSSGARQKQKQKPSRGLWKGRPHLTRAPLLGSAAAICTNPARNFVHHSFPPISIQIDHLLLQGEVKLLINQ